MIPNLSSESVIREGYVNMRLSLDPGYPGLPWSLWKR